MREVASILLKQGKLSEAEKAARQAWNLDRTYLLPGDVRTLRAELVLAKVLAGQHLLAAESPLTEQCLKDSSSETPAAAIVHQQAAEFLADSQADVDRQQVQR